MTLLSSVVESGGKVVILCHLNADPDAIGSGIGAYDFLKSKGVDAKIAAAGGVNALARNLLKKLGHKIEINPRLDGVDTLFIVDTCSFSQLAPVNVRDFSGNIFVADHHIPDDDLKNMAKEGIFDETITSASEIIYALLEEEGFEFTKESCLALITGIVTDTAHLQFARPETLRTVADLLDKCKMTYPEVLSFITIPTEPSRKIAHLKAASRLEMQRLDEWIVGLSHVGSFEASAARSLVKIGADVSFVCSVDSDKEARVSVRANNTFIKKTKLNFAKDYAPRLAEILDGTGGGHVAAISVNGTYDGTESELMKDCFSLLEAVYAEKKL